MTARILFVVTLALLAARPLPVCGDEAADVEALGQLNESYVQAFNRHEAAAIGRLFTAQGDYQILTGELLEAPDAIVGGHASFFRNNPEVKLSGKSLKRKFLTPHVVLSHGQWKATGGPAGVPNEGHWTAVQVRTDGKWRYEAIRISLPLGP